MAISTRDIGMNATERLGAFVARSIGAPLAADVAERAAACLLDVLAHTLMARRERTFRAMRAAVTPVAPGPGTARASGRTTPSRCGVTVRAILDRVVALRPS